jgi:putative flippase GtrA
VVYDKLIVVKFVKFCLIGFSGMLIDFGITWLLKEKVRINKYIANSTGFTLAATSNYFLNRIWTFHSENKQIFTEYSLFIVISLAGLAINNFVIFLLNDKLKLNFYLSKLIAVGVVTCWNFIMNYLITFSGSYEL